MFTHRPRSPFKPLKQNEIRILKVESLSHFKFSFKTISLDDAKSYVALSYRWGQPNVGCVYVDDCPISISQGLVECFTRFQKGFSDKSVQPWKEYLWIDAVCINQDDWKFEKPQQVRLMSRIYEEADNVFVWLGEPPDHSLNKLAVQKLKELGAAYVKMLGKAFPMRPWWWPRRPGEFEKAVQEWGMKVAQEELARLKSQSNPSIATWTGISNIMKTQWWHRTWVYQEATVKTNWKIIKWYGTWEKGRSGTLGFGSETFEWMPDLGALREVLLRLNGFKDMDKTIFREAALMELSSLVRTKATRTWTGKMTWSLLEAVQSLRPTMCGDPRDKIYAAIALTNDPNNFIVEPSYEIPVEQLYTIFAARIVTIPGHELDILGYAQKPLPTQTKPTPWLAIGSWVPDWTFDRRMWPLTKYLFVDNKHYRDRKFTLYDKRAVTTNSHEKVPAYMASHGIQAAMPRVYGSTLIVTGICIDTIEDLIPYDSTREFSLQKVQGWTTTVNSGGGYFTKEPFNLVMKHTVCADIDIDANLLPVKRGGLYDGDLEKMDPSQLSPERRQVQFLGSEKMTKAMKHRAITLTRKHYAGLAPESSKPGDLICAFSGGHVLYVIRYNHASRNNEYIGEAYIHGMMDGAASRLLQRGVAPLTEFVIV